MITSTSHHHICIFRFAWLKMKLNQYFFNVHGFLLSVTLLFYVSLSLLLLYHSTPFHPFSFPSFPHSIHSFTLSLSSSLTQSLSFLSLLLLSLSPSLLFPPLSLCSRLPSLWRAFQNLWGSLFSCLSVTPQSNRKGLCAFKEQSCLCTLDCRPQPSRDGTLWGGAWWSVPLVGFRERWGHVYFIHQISLLAPEASEKILINREIDSTDYSTFSKSRWHCHLLVFSFLRKVKFHSYSVIPETGMNLMLEIWCW